MNINNLHIICHVPDIVLGIGDIKISKTISSSRNSQTRKTIIYECKIKCSVVQCNDGVSNIILTYKIMKSGTQLCLNPRSTFYHISDFVPQFLCLYNGDDNSTL